MKKLFILLFWIANFGAGYLFGLSKNLTAPTSVVKIDHCVISNGINVKCDFVRIDNNEIYVRETNDYGLKFNFK